MKNLNIIGKSLLVLFVSLQINTAKANELNKSDIEDLAKKIAKSESCIDFMAVKLTNNIILLGSISEMSDNERLVAKQKIENYSKLSKEEFTTELKEEYAKLIGFDSYSMYQNATSIFKTCFEKLVEDFPEIATMNSSDKSLLFQTIDQNFDYNSFNSATYMSKVACIRGYLYTCVKCAAPGIAETLVYQLVGCMGAGQIAWTIITDGVAALIPEGPVVADLYVCAVLFGVKTISPGGVLGCVKSFIVNVKNNCYKK